MANFTVDTHLFRELGEFLVGRPSTALIELIKNAYDADAVEVTVFGENLKDPDRGRIVITDSGNGMGREDFENGFLRIASRLKEEGDRRSPVFGRRYTGAKGVGRLAAHKLAKFLRIESVPREPNKRAVTGSIDWDSVEQCETLDEVEGAKAILVKDHARPTGAKHGTVITLERLRYKWTDSEFTRLFREITGFIPPLSLLQEPEELIGEKSILGRIQPTDVEEARGNKFECRLEGDFDAGQPFFDAVAAAADWVLEIEAKKSGRVRYAVLPTKRLRAELKDQGVTARAFQFEIPHPNTNSGPFFQARILIRDGSGSLAKEAKTWVTENAGVRVYFEGFRVLPYGDRADDWLSIDADYTRRDRVLPMLDRVAGAPLAQTDEGLSRRNKNAYFGGVFLQQRGAQDLKMLVNREGFIPTQSYEDLVRLVRTGIDLSVRAGAAVRAPLREQRATERTGGRIQRLELRAAVERAVGRAKLLATEARQVAATGDYTRATALIDEAARTFAEGAEVNERLLTERSTMQILASLGLHMTAFVHEIRGLLGMARALDETLTKLRERSDLGNEARKSINVVHGSVTELRRVVERQAAYLTDVTSPDARRRRSRQKLAERFEVALNLFAPQIERLGIAVQNSIPAELKIAPMFPAEVTLILTNLVSNAVKAADKQGRISASAKLGEEGATHFRLENTGAAVDLEEAERWFLPFETTTAELDPSLGQGMGMGLTITRNLLEEYGATIHFVRPSRGMSTAIEVIFPG